MQYILLFFSRRYVLSLLQTPCDRTLFCVYPYRSTDDVAEMYCAFCIIPGPDLFHFPCSSTRMVRHNFVNATFWRMRGEICWRELNRRPALGAKSREPSVGTSSMLNLRYPLMNYFNNPTARVAAVYHVVQRSPLALN